LKESLEREHKAEQERIEKAKKDQLDQLAEEIRTRQETVLLAYAEDRKMVKEHFTSKMEDQRSRIEKVINQELRDAMLLSDRSQSVDSQGSDTSGLNLVNPTPVQVPQSSAVVDERVSHESSDSQRHVQSRSRDSSASAGSKLGWLSKGYVPPLHESPTLAVDSPATQYSTSISADGLDRTHVTWDDFYLSLDRATEQDNDDDNNHIISGIEAINRDCIPDQTLREQILRQVQQLSQAKDWTKMIGERVCIRRAVAKKSSKGVGKYACGICTKRRKMCVKSAANGEDQRHLIVAPLHPSLRNTSNPGDGEFWVMDHSA